MKMKLMYAALMFAVLAGSSAVYAQMGQEQGGGQWGHGQPMTADQRLQHMTKQLNLSDAQQQQIKPILENEEKQMQALHQDSSLSQQESRSKMMQIAELVGADQADLECRSAAKVRADDEPPGTPWPRGNGSESAARGSSAAVV